MRINKSVILGLILGALAAISARAQAPAAFQEEFHQIYPLNPGGRIELKNINGWVKISSWNRNEVKVDALKYAGTKERLDQAKIQVDATADSMYIKTRYEDEHNLTFTDDDAIHNPATVDYTLIVPAGARLDGIKLINGNLDVKDISGDVHASCINGRLRASGLRGRIELSTINGTLDANLDNVAQTSANVARPTSAGDVTLKSVNGHLVVTLPSDTDAEVRARTVHGGIDNDFGLPVDERSFSHSLAARLGSGAARIELKNVNGSVSIQRASDGKPLSPTTNLLPPKREKETSF